MTDDEAEPLAAIALALVSRIREYGPEDNARWLKHQLPASAGWFQLVFLLAALVPDNLTAGQLTAWIQPPDEEPTT